MKYYILTPATRKQLHKRAEREGKSMGQVITEWIRFAGNG